jgi:hypothetical protein
MFLSKRGDGVKGICVRTSAETMHENSPAKQSLNCNFCAKAVSRIGDGKIPAAGVKK